jgi:hypothetical protein
MIGTTIAIVPRPAKVTNIVANSVNPRANMSLCASHHAKFNGIEIAHSGRIVVNNGAMTNVMTDVSNVGKSGINTL